MSDIEQGIVSGGEAFKAPRRRRRRPVNLPIDVGKMPIRDFLEVLPTHSQQETVARLSVLGDPPTLQELANEAGVTREAIRSRKERAVIRLKRYKREEPVDGSSNILKRGEDIRKKVSDEHLKHLLNPSLTHQAISEMDNVPWNTVQGRRKALGIKVKMGRPKRKENIVQ